MKKETMFHPKNEEFFKNVSTVLKLASGKLVSDNKLLAETCRDLSLEFKKLDKDYKLIKK